MVDLIEKIKNLIENETKKGHFCELKVEKHSKLIQRIIENYEIMNDLKQDFSNLPKNAELVFVAAPTGAGKDTLVARLCYKNPEKKYIELNMDIFRYYYSAFMDDAKSLTDKSFAAKTNEFSYEMYVTVQELLLQEFPGTNIVITGTLRDVEWVEKTFERFKLDSKTNYKIKIACLAVPKKESAISVIERYIGIVNNNFEPGTARYTSMKYHDETFEKFPNNLEYFQKKFEDNPGKLIDEIEVYRRSNSIFDFEEDTRVYTSEDKTDTRKALDVVLQLRLKNFSVEYEDISILVQRILKNKDYLKSQDTLKEVIRDVAVILEYPEIVKRLDKIQADEEGYKLK